LEQNIKGYVMTWWLDPEKVKQRAENYKKNFRKKYGVDNPQQLKEIKEKTNETFRKRYGGIGFDCELGEKSRKTIKEKYGEDNIMKVEEFKFIGDKNPLRRKDIADKVSKGVKKYIKKEGHWLKGKTYEEILGKKRAKERIKELRISGAIGCSMTPRISAPQLQLYEMVKEKYPTAILEYPVGDFCIDIAVPEEMIAFEYDGSYWHDEEKDKIRDSILEQLGWTVYRFVDKLPNFL
jgi:hypothetical protein